MSTTPPLTKVAGMAAARITIGATALLAPGPASRLFGYPAAQDTPTARLMGRMFGVRNIAFGALAWRTRNEPSLARDVYRLNAGIDAADAAAIAVPLIGRHGIDRAALSSVALALSAVMGWVRLQRIPGGAGS